MFEHYIFKINASVAMGLKSIKGLKNLAAHFEQYEYVIKLNDIKKHFESIEEQLGVCEYPVPTPNTGLTPKGKLYFNQIFTYNIFHNWKNIPDNFNDLFRERKDHLNSIFEFDDVRSKQLIDLNRKLAIQEKLIQEFFNFNQYDVRLKGLNNIVNYFAQGNLTLKCYTQSNTYEFTYGSFNPAIPFYQFDFSLNDFISSIPIFYSKDQPQPDFSQTLPIELRDEKICLLFSLLATDGLLAWEDFLNIDRVELELDVKYKFKTS